MCSFVLLAISFERALAHSISTVENSDLAGSATGVETVAQF